MTIPKQTYNEGSVLIITVLIAAVMFSIGIALAGILEKEVRRQLYGERSQRAINVANSALECVLFNDFRRLAFDSVLAAPNIPLDCGDLYHAVEKSDWSKEYVPDNVGTNLAPGEGTYEFVIVQSNSSAFTSTSSHPCAYTTIEKVCEGSKSDSGKICDSGIIVNSIEIRGYNICEQDNPDEELVRRFKIYY